MDRRNFLKLLGISSGTALISSCGVDKANEKIIPYVIPPEEDIFVGNPAYFTTTCTECPANCGMQVTANEKVYHDVRNIFPTKLEGIAGHPVNDGALCMRGQASLFRLYHPDRIKRPMMRDGDGNFRVTTWKEAYAKIIVELAAATGEGKRNMYFSGRTTGTMSGLTDDFCKEMSVERLPEFEVFSHANLKKANDIVFNRPEIPHYRIENADFLLTVGADVVETFMNPVASANHIQKAKDKNNLSWYHIEPAVSLTGVQASKRFAIKLHSEVYLLAFLLQSLSQQNSLKKSLPARISRLIPDYSITVIAERTGLSEENLRLLLSRFANAKTPLIIAGGVSTAQENGLETAVFAALLQWATGMTDNTVDFDHAENYGSVGSMLDVRKLEDSLKNKQVGVLFISRTDPVTYLPEAEQFVELMKNTRLRVALSDFMTSTVQECDIVLPLSHSLEAWGDAAPRKGIRNVIQPAIEPQYDTRSEGDILLQIMAQKSGAASAQFYNDYLIDKWHSLYGEGETVGMLERGYREEPVPSLPAILSGDGTEAFLKNAGFVVESSDKPVLVITPSIRAYDGRSKVLPLMSEIPDPLTTITYGEWISVSDKTAKKMGWKDRDEVAVELNGVSLKFPVKVQHLLPENIYMVQRDLIYPQATPVDSRSGEESWYVKDISVNATGNHIPMPIMSGSMHEDNRGLLPPEEEEHPYEHKEEHPVGRMYAPHEHDNYRWGMAIDMDSCIGCSACVAACYVENNLAITGKKAHLNGREMSWIRLEPWVKDDETINYDLMLCQQCDDAPCEPVCPVYATYHSKEGLNTQVYNRCVGTRYCSNNCPYKVRRFNWFDFRLPEPWDKMYNPEVSVRTRGIMEKCTFCIQRIRHAKDKAKDENRLVQDGEITTACAQTCPTNAITFGNLMDKNSRVSKLAHSNRAYRALEELGTEPAVHYLPKKESKEEA